MTEKFIQHRVYLTGVSEQTVKRYRWSFKAFDGCLDSKDAVVERIAQLKGRGVNHITINSYLRAVNAYFMWLHTEHGKEKLRIPKLKEEQKILSTLSTDAVSAIVRYKAVGTNLRRAHMVTLVALDTGLRASEILALTKEDINVENLTIKAYGKGGKYRVVPFSIELRKSLFRFLSSQTARFVFGTKNNTKLTTRNLHRDIKVVGKKLSITGVRFSAHTFRHTFAVMYLRNGGNLEFLRRILGHTSLTTTQKYLRSFRVS